MTDDHDVESDANEGNGTERTEEADEPADEEEIDPDEREVEHEVERAVDREAAATALRRVADGVVGGRVLVDADDGPVAVTVPREVTLEVEVEVEADEHSLEVELEWPAPPEDGGAAAGAADIVDDPTSNGDGDRTPIVDEESMAETGDEQERRTIDDAGPADPVPVDGLDERTGDGARFELFRDRADEWRWRLVHRNGNIIADSGEGYTRKHNARKGLQSVVRNAPTAPIVDVDE